MLTKALIFALVAAHPQMSREPGRPPWVKVAVACFGAGEQSGGMTKICYYNCLGSQVAITIPGTSICPVTINR